MNWKDDQIEKLILFYSHNCLFLVPDFWYQFLVPVSGQYVMGILADTLTALEPLNRRRISLIHNGELFMPPI